MIRRIAYLAIAAALAALPLSALPVAPAQAAQLVVCAPTETGKAEGPRRITNPNTGNSYSVNAAGCVIVAPADLGYLFAQGFTLGANLFSTVGATITAQNFASVVVPAGAYIHQIVVQNTTANAVTGGIKVGTTAGGTDVVAALTCAANCLTFVADTALLKRVFSATASQTLSIDAVTSWNSASVNVTVLYSYF